MDLPVLRIGAARHHLRLPRQLIKDARQNREWLHLDLGKEHHCGTYVHMSEVAMALNLPAKFAAFVREYVWPRVHVVIDLHSGGQVTRAACCSGSSSRRPPRPAP